MSPKPISIQLYSLREAAEQDYVGMLKRVAQIGYKGVEVSSLYGLTPKAFRSLIEDLGMTVSSTHSLCPFSMPIQEVIESVGILGLDSLVSCRFWEPDYATLDAIKKTAEVVTAAIEQLKPAGIKLVLHNHHWEYLQVEGRLAYDWFAELCPDAQFEIDTYWASNFGANNVAEQVAKLKARTPFLHIKDGPLVQGESMVAAGQGKMDFPAVIAAADDSVLRWHVVELDTCATDMFQAVEESYRYLVENQFAVGTK